MNAPFVKPAATAIAAVAVIVLTISLHPSHSAGSPSIQMIDRIIGQGSFNTVFPILPGPNQQERITARLAYLEGLLRTRDVSAWPADLRAERTRNIERLKEYRLRGIYPRNEADPGRPLPCFIDGHGAICAVGYLIEQSAGRDFAEWINRQYQYATVAEMSLPALDAWIARSGLTKAEIKTIQEPGFTSGYLQSRIEQMGGTTSPVGIVLADRPDTAQYGPPTPIAIAGKVGHDTLVAVAAGKPSP
jgi:hypothetical protein